MCGPRSRRFGDERWTRSPRWSGTSRASSSAAELTSTDDEHDPEGPTIAYERAQVWALLRQAREDLVALDQALVRVDFGTATICSVCGGPIAIERVLALPAVRVCIGCAS